MPRSPSLTDGSAGQRRGMNEGVHQRTPVNGRSYDVRRTSAFFPDFFTIESLGRFVPQLFRPLSVNQTFSLIAQRQSSPPDSRDGLVVKAVRSGLV